MQVNSLNRVIIVGRMGSDPDTKFAKSGTAVTNFSLATNEKWKDNDHTEWHKCVVFGESAERFAEWVSKGQLVLIEGKLKTDVWEKDGEKRYSTSIVVDTWTTLSKGKDKEAKDTVDNLGSGDDLPF